MMEEIATLGAGREMDSLIAKHFMGYEFITPKHGVCRTCQHCGRSCDECGDGCEHSTDERAAPKYD